MVNKLDYMKSDDETPQQPENDAQPQESRPDWLPEKFATAEDMAKSYAELEQKQAKQGQDDSGTVSDDSSDVPDSNTDEQPDSPTGTLSPDVIDSYAQKWSEQGQQFTDEQYQELDNLGLSRTMVDRYVEGQMAVLQNQATELFSEIGGIESYQEMAQWASQNWSQEEINSFDHALSQNMETAKLAVQGLQAKYQQANGKQAKFVQGEQPSKVGSVFNSSAEITRAMSDPRYKTDPAYRDEILQKLNNSNV